jgi:predicted kinase
MMQITRDKIFVCLVGVPGSGKSTFVKNNLKGYKVISSDDLIEALAKNRGKTYNEIFFEEIKQAERDIFVLLEKAFFDGDNVVWDRTNVDKAKRATVLARVPDHYYKIAVYFEITLDAAKERLTNREKETGKHIPLVALESMLAKLEPPTKAEGFDEILLV